ncbi:MAG: FliM/FliN family flagellar motor switch protein [Pseudomonadales bacterium]|nr:FliM/FliN family flagellar motor switch protein [Pseudomonadales bacterium]
MTQKTMSIEEVELSPLSDSQTGELLVGNKMDLVSDVKVELTVELGDVEMTVSELFALEENSVVALDKLVSEDLKLMMNGQCVAAGKLMVVDDNFGIQVSKVFAK